MWNVLFAKYIVCYTWQKQSPEEFYKKRFLLKIFQYLQEITCAGVSF